MSAEARFTMMLRAQLGSANKASTLRSESGSAAINATALQRLYSSQSVSKIKVERYQGTAKKGKQG